MSAKVRYYCPRPGLVGIHGYRLPWVHLWAGLRYRIAAFIAAVASLELSGPASEDTG